MVSATRFACWNTAYSRLKSKRGGGENGSKRIEALIEVIKDANVTELALKRDDSSVVVRKSPRVTEPHK